MKKILIFIIAAVALLFLSDFIYKTYKRHQRQTKLTDDRAVLYIYFNVPAENVIEYFNLPDSLHHYIEEKYHVSCEVPSYEHLHLTNNRTTQDLSTINCAEPFNFDRQLEMKREYQSSGYSLSLKLMAANSQRVIATRNIHVPWNYGRVNHIVVAPDREYLYCSN